MDLQRAQIQERDTASRSLTDSLRTTVLDESQQRTDTQIKADAVNTQNDEIQQDLTRQAERLGVERLTEALDDYRGAARELDNTLRDSRKQLAEELSNLSTGVNKADNKQDGSVRSQESNERIERLIQEQESQIQDGKTALERSAERLELAVRESNLIYDIDHYRPQSLYSDLSNKASNVGFLMADENRRKGADEFSEKQLQAMDERNALSLRDALKSEESARKAVSEMLGSRRFGEINELNELWQKASNNETARYSEAQSNMRKLIAEDQSEAAALVRKALSMAQIDIVPNGQSYKFRLNDEAYRRNLGGKSYSYKNIRDATDERLQR